jgi:hypothetical protein
MATDAQTLMTQAKCYMCAAQMSMFQAMEIALLAQISVARSAANDVTPQGLITAGACYQCGGQLSTAETMIVVLLKQIAS